MIRTIIVLAIVGYIVFSVIGIARSEDHTAYVAVARQKATLRDPDQKVIGSIGKAEIVTVLAKEDRRCFIQTPTGTTGWVHDHYLVELTQAEPIFDGMIRAKPNDPIWYAMRSLVYEQRGDNEKAIRDMSRAIELGHTDLNMLVNRGMLQAAIGKFDAAISDYNTAIRRGFTSPVVYTNRAAAFLAKKDVDRAIADFDHVIRQHPTRSSAYYQRGVAHRQKGSIDRAIADFSTAIKHDAKNIEALNARGYSWFLKGDHERAIADFSTVIKQDAGSAIAFNNRGFNRQQIGDYQGALEDYEQAILIEPEYGLAYQNKAWLLASCPVKKWRDGQTALAAAKKACELGKHQFPSDLKALAAAHAELGDFEEAIKWQQKVLAQVDAETRQAEQQMLDLYRAGKPYRFGSVD